MNTTQDPCYEIASPEHKKRVLSLTVAFCTRSLDAISLFKSHLRHWWPRACTCCLTTAALPSFALACPMQCFSLRRAAPSLVDVTSFLVRRSSSHRREPWCRCGVALADPKALSAKPDRADQYSSTHSHSSQPCRLSPRHVSSASAGAATITVTRLASGQSGTPVRLSYEICSCALGLARDSVSDGETLLDMGGTRNRSTQDIMKMRR